MNPTYAIALYLSIFSLIFILFLLFNILKINRGLSQLTNRVTHLQKDMSKIQRAEKEVVNALVSRDRAREIFREEGMVDLKNALKEDRKAKIIERNKKLNFLLEQVEGFIGKNLLDKIGIISFLIGMVLLVSVGIQYNWINSIGRVFLGLVIAGMLLSVGYLLRKRFVVLSSVLLGGGLSSLVLTLFSAFYVYSLMGLGLTYALIALVVIVAIGLSIIMGRSEIAVLTFAAGFVAPLTVNLTAGDYWIVFTFVLLLDLGVILYDYYRKSLLINVVSFAFTYLIYAVWLIDKFWFKKEEVPFYGSMIFLTVFYLMIFVIVLINNIKENRRFLPIEFSMLLTANALYYTAGYIIIVRTGVEYKGIFTLWISLVNYGFFLWLFPRKNFDRRILNLFLGLSIMFIALVIPVEYMGKSPTLVWALQAVVLMFVGLRADLAGMKLGSIELTLLMLASLGFDLYDQYLNIFKDMEPITPIFNRGFLSSMLAVVSLLTNAYLLKYEKRDYFGFKFIKTKLYQAFLGISALIAFYIAFRFELRSLATQVYENDLVVDVVLSLLNYGLLLLLALPALFIQKKQVMYMAIISFVLAYLMYIFDYAFSWADLRNLYLVSPFVGTKEYNYHYYSALMLLLISISGLSSIRRAKSGHPIVDNLLTLFMIGLVLVFLSNELDNIIVVMKYKPNILIREILTKVFSMYYTMLWSAFALLLLVIGFIFHTKEVRIGAFVLMTITLIKVFVYDYFKLRTDELMLVFMWLGFVMIIGSITYQIFSGKGYKERRQQVYKPDSVR